MENLKQELQQYIDENFLIVEEDFEDARADFEDDDKKFPPIAMLSYVAFAPAIDFQEMYEEEKGETFSNMLMRLIAESGEKNSDVYNRANIDRRHFSKIANNENYRTTRETALAFAIALRLNLEQTKDLLSTAGYTLTNTNLGDVIVTFFIKRKIFDVFLINEYLHEYKQTLLGG